MRFVIDNQLPRAVARWLTEQGHDAIHVLDVGMAQTADDDICAFAGETARIVVSKDEDFLAHVLRPGATVQLVWVRIPNCTNAELMNAFTKALPSAIPLLAAGNQIIEIR